MKKCEKGTPGYLDYKIKAEIVRTIIYFAIVAAVFLLGYSQTHTNKNLLTIVAVVGCLPACKALVGVITRIPHRSIAPETAREIEGKSARLSVLYDLVVTSTEKIMPVDSIVISGNIVVGYTSSPKVDVKYAARHIQDILRQNGFSHASVRLHHEYKMFLDRVEGLANIAAVEKADQSKTEEQIGRIILNISL